MEKTYLLIIQGIQRTEEIPFDTPEELEDHLRHLVNVNGFSIKTDISVLNLDANDNLLDQFIGEIWHYVEDWNHLMMPNTALKP
jgi:hypothetical protein